MARREPGPGAVQVPLLAMRPGRGPHPTTFRSRRPRMQGIPDWHGPRPAVDRVVVAVDGRNYTAHAREVTFYLNAMARHPADVATVGFCSTFDHGEGIGVCRTLRARRAFRWDVPLLLVEMETEAEQLARNGHRIAVLPRVMQEVPEAVREGLRDQALAGINGCTVSLDREKILTPIRRWREKSELSRAGG